MLLLLIIMFRREGGTLDINLVIVTLHFPVSVGCKCPFVSIRFDSMRCDAMRFDSIRFNSIAAKNAICSSPTYITDC